MLGAKAIARAKINLFLEVGGVREDGYHEIRSVMQSLELADELFFRRTESSGPRIKLRLSDRQLPAGEENLIWKAAEAFDRATGVLSGGGIEVIANKKIPVAAGLAGGSADAAATILAMNQIWELELTLEKQLEIAATVGSDVPFCLQGGTGVATGRGEEVERMVPLPSYQVVLASSGEPVSTGEVYGRFDALDGGSRKPAPGELESAFSRLVESIRERSFEGICACLHNSLESATIAGDRVEEYKKAALAAGAGAALMTGSGPTVFALTEDLEGASEIAWELEKIAPVTIVTSFAEAGAEIQP